MIDASQLYCQYHHRIETTNFKMPTLVLDSIWKENQNIWQLCDQTPKFYFNAKLCAQLLYAYTCGIRLSAHLSYFWHGSRRVQLNNQCYVRAKTVYLVKFSWLKKYQVKYFFNFWGKWRFDFHLSDFEIKWNNTQSDLIQTFDDNSPESWIQKYEHVYFFLILNF